MKDKTGYLCKKERTKGWLCQFRQTYLTDFARCEIAVMTKGVYHRSLGKDYCNASFYYNGVSYPGHLVRLSDGNMRILDVVFPDKASLHAFTAHVRSTMARYRTHTIVRSLLQLIYYINVPLAIVAGAKLYLLGQVAYIPLCFLYLLFLRYLYVKTRNL